MLLAIDIGNTNISGGFFKGKSLVRRFDILTHGYTAKELSAYLVKTKVDAAIICSVVPKITARVEKDLKDFIGKQVYIIGKTISIPIKNLYRRPRQVGQDRLVNAYAGAKFYGTPLIIVDFGTAVTFDVVSVKGEYLGGMILPGLDLSLEALARGTALLPRVKLKEPAEFIGRDTQNSILSGIVYGFAYLVDGMVERARDNIGKDAGVIGTGGNIQIIKKYSQKIERIDRDLTLKGLNLVFQSYTKG